MAEELKNLVRDTLAYLKEPSFMKIPLFATEEETLLFQKSRPLEKNLPPPPVILAKPIPPQAPKPIPKKETPVIEEVIAPKSMPPAAEPYPQIKKVVEKIAPHFKLEDHVPDDTEAKRIATAWKEKIPDASVILLACDQEADTLDLLKSLAKAIDQHLAKSKVISAERLEREKKWDLFLSQNPLRLIIASAAAQKLPDFMRYYRANPAQSQVFLDKAPLLLLAPASTYKVLEHKALLWKTLCQMLK